MKLGISIVLLVTLLLSACTSVQKRPPKKATSKTSELFEASKKDIEDGKQKDATAKLESILDADPDSDLADDAAIELGNLYFSNQNYEQAYDQYMKVVQSNIFSPKEVDALYLAGKSLYFLDRFDASSSLLEKSLAIDPIPMDTRVQIHELLFKVRQQQGDLIDSLESLVFLSQNHSQDEAKSNYLGTGISIINKDLEKEELEYVAGRGKFESFRGYAMALLAEKSLVLRDFDEAARYYEGVIEILPDSEAAVKGREFLSRQEAQKKVDPLAIGVVLPLTGRYSTIAYKILNGIQFALGIYGEGSSPFKLAVVDSEGNPDVAKRAVEKLVLEDHVVAIVGSLLSSTADVVSKTAHEFGIPSIALSQKAGVTGNGDSVFRFSLTSDMQVKHLVEHAMQDLGMKKFAILYPNEKYGVEYANLFWDHVLARGGQITAAQIYQPGETDFNGMIRRLVGTFYIEDRIEEYKYRLKEWQKENLRFSRRTPPDDLLPPVVDFDALFIPDNTKALGQIAPTLRYNDVNEVMLLGTNLWNTRSVISRTRKVAKNLLFVDSQFLSRDQFKLTPFYQRFVDIFGEAPGHFAIQAFDTARLVRHIIEDGATDRQSVITRLQNLKSYTGISGQLEMNSRREIVPPMSTLTVNGGAIKKINGIKN